MSLKTDPVLRLMLYEGAGADLLSAEERFATLSALLDQGFAVKVEPVETIFSQTPAGTLLVLGKFPSTAGPNRAGTALNVRFLNLAGQDAPSLQAAIESVRQETASARHGEWKPWFPVIDYDRCTNCMQCLSFCLFDVYGVDAHQKIQVQNNDNCKTSCPACSRVCPEAAIMFPKYKSGPINGDIVSDADLQREKMKIDISALLGGDVYQLLRDRSEKAKSRFSKERDADKALKERQKCLVKLAAMGDIPPEVLASLPRPEEIERRAREAAAKAQAVLQA
jgi:Pyruvate/2-oxoacid:ferredoxin oxidoreductase delta subunit